MKSHAHIEAFDDTWHCGEQACLLLRSEVFLLTRYSVDKRYNLGIINILWGLNSMLIKVRVTRRNTASTFTKPGIVGWSGADWNPLVTSDEKRLLVIGKIADKYWSAIIPTGAITSVLFQCAGQGRGGWELWKLRSLIRSLMTWGYFQILWYNKGKKARTGTEKS